MSLTFCKKQIVRLDWLEKRVESNDKELSSSIIIVSLNPIIRKEFSSSYTNLLIKITFDSSFDKYSHFLE